MQTQLKISSDLIVSHGLTSEEYQKILKILGREPNLVELGIFSVMWSEHCSYKSTRKWLKTLPTEAPWVICGPGENAGVIDIGDGLAAIFKMESHNHPSFIEPYQGAATGVGGILRDVFTMGARPVANLNSLRFGKIDHPKTKHLLEGVVAGIGGYGNCVGVPTVGGECTFHEAYNGNILVNAMTVGIAEQDKIFYSKASGVGNPVVYVGSKTGRDGIHGATMASAEFDEDSEEKRPTVQVGDPFTEKLLIEACLELMATDAIIAIQDMGAAGLTSSSIEMAGKGGLGIELDLDNVPVREKGMTPYEIMLSESQERMLMIIKPEKESVAKEIFDKWELDFAVIGQLTDTGNLTLKTGGTVVAEMPVSPLSEEAPVYDWPYVETPKRLELKPEQLQIGGNIMKALKTLLASPDLCSKRWIWEQYDYQVMGDTVAGPGANAAIVRIHGTDKALAMTSDCTPRYCFADPYEGGKQAVAESYRNLISVGATPLAITNCLNFGSPERPEIMGQLVGCLQGMKEACEKLQMPVISGNVSLYNETSGRAILPTPTIGAVGLIEQLQTPAKIKPGDNVIIIGETNGHLGSSVFLREVCSSEDGAPPLVDLDLELKNGEFVSSLIKQGLISSCSDISDGGLLITVAEICMRAEVGAEIELPDNIQECSWLFGEDQARYIVTCASEEVAAIIKRASSDGVYAKKIGKIAGDNLILRKVNQDNGNSSNIAIAEILDIYSNSLINKMK